MDKAAQATLVGVLTEAGATASGLSLEELRTRSFVKILNGRRLR